MYYLATQEGDVANRQAFTAAVAEYTGDPVLSGGSRSSWEILFRAIALTATDEKVVIVLDEFQYLGKADPAFPSVIQKVWDTQLQDKNIMLILCGSLITMMEQQTLVHSSPLYGRRTGQLKLKQIPFSDYPLFFADEQAPDIRTLVDRYADGTVFPGQYGRVGRWWDGQGEEIDVVATGLDDSRDILFGECKFWSKPVGMDVLASLQEKAAKVHWRDDSRKECFALFSVSGFSDQLKKIAESSKNVFLFDHSGRLA